MIQEVSSKYFAEGRNPEAPQTLWGDENPSRQSESAPPSTTTTPHPPAGAGHPEAPAPARRTRACAKCATHRTSSDFPLAADPVARTWATRRWCGECLLVGGHISPARLAKHRAATAAADQAAAAKAQARAERAARADRAADERRQRAEDRVRTLSIANKLIDQALEDPLVRDAVRMAAKAVA